MKAKKVRSLRDAKTMAQTYTLKRDNWTYGDFWIVSDGNCVTIAQQPIGTVII